MKNNLTQHITIGCDPEFFLYDSKKSMNVSAHEIIPGSKKEPHKLRHGAVQLDGTAVEFNIDPASTAEEFSHNINETLADIRKMVPTRYDFNFSPAVFYDKEYWDKIPEAHKKLGCDPDFGTYEESPVPQVPPNPGKAYANMRTGAGHIHIGWTKVVDPLDSVHYWDARKVVSSLWDIYNPYKEVFDTDCDRSRLYGNGAVFRPKIYGVEFRSPSNAWLKYPKLYDWFFKFPKEVVEKLDTEFRLVTSGFYYSTYFNNKSRLNTLNDYAANKNFTTLPYDWDSKVAKW